MTDQCKKWVMEHAKGALAVGGFDDKIAEFWLSAFCDEIERRVEARKFYPHARDTAVAITLYELKRELLGGDDATQTK